MCGRLDLKRRRLLTTNCSPHFPSARLPFSPAVEVLSAFVVTSCSCVCCLSLGDWAAADRRERSTKRRRPSPVHFCLYIPRAAVNTTGRAGRRCTGLGRYGPEHARSVVVRAWSEVGGGGGPGSGRTERAVGMGKWCQAERVGSYRAGSGRIGSDRIGSDVHLRTTLVCSRSVFPRLLDLGRYVSSVLTPFFIKLTSCIYYSLSIDISQMYEYVQNNLANIGNQLLFGNGGGN